LLSRIDGITSCRILRQIGGLPAEQVDQCIERWVKQGVLLFDEESPPTLSAGGAASEPGEESFDSQIDPSLDLPVEIQRKVLEFDSTLERPYHEILGVAIEADLKTVKKAYFGLSKQFHPDRYFRRNLGPFAERIERCFKKILEAYELLSDPATRAEVQRQLAAEPPLDQPAKPVSPDLSRAASRERLAKRLARFRGHGTVFEERRRKAKNFFESSKVASSQGRWLEAAGSVRLAIAFDPSERAYKEAFAEVQRKANDERAGELVEQAEAALTSRDLKAAAGFFEEALQFRPFDPEINIKAARLQWQALGKLRKAQEYATAAREIEPDNAGYRRVLGQILKAAGLKPDARRELEAAIKLDPRDSEARAELKSL
jgi:curved DNA-binding protein CbpA